MTHRKKSYQQGVEDGIKKMMKIICNRADYWGYLHIEDIDNQYRRLKSAQRKKARQ